MDVLSKLKKLLHKFLPIFPNNFKELPGIKGFEYELDVDKGVPLFLKTVKRYVSFSD
jgi:hypothetical protein